MAKQLFPLPNGAAQSAEYETTRINRRVDEYLSQYIADEIADGMARALQTVSAAK